MKKLRLGQVEEFLQRGDLFWEYLPCDGFAIGVVQPHQIVGPAGSEDIACENPSRFDIGRIVQQHQGLGGRVGARSPRDTNLSVWGIETDHGRGWAGPFPEGVHASSKETFCGIGNVLASAFDGNVLPKSSGLIGFDARTTEFAVQKAADGQGIVADGFGR